MKTEIHPAYDLVTVHCSCGNDFQTRSTKGGDISVEICAECHPFYTGKQKLMDTGGRVERFRRRAAQAQAAAAAKPAASTAAAPAAPATRSARRPGIRPPMAASIGGQAVLEGVMMRGPSSWAVAVRRPDGRISEIVHDVASVAVRRRWLRLPIIRGVVALGESLTIGFKALAISANFATTDEGEEDASEGIGRGYIIGSFVARSPSRSSCSRCRPRCSPSGSA